MSKIPNLGEYGFVPDFNHQLPFEQSNNPLKKVDNKENDSHVEQPQKQKTKQGNNPIKEKSKIKKSTPDKSEKENSNKKKSSSPIEGDSNSNNGGKYFLFILLGILLLIISGIIYYFFFRNKETAFQRDIAQQANSNSIEPIPLNYNPNKILSNPFLKNQYWYNQNNLGFSR